MNIVFAMTVVGVWQVASASYPNEYYDQYFQKSQGYNGPQYQIGEEQLRDLYREDPEGLRNYVQGKKVVKCYKGIETKSGDITVQKMSTMEYFLSNRCSDVDMLNDISIYNTKTDFSGNSNGYSGNSNGYSGNSRY